MANLDFTDIDNMLNMFSQEAPAVKTNNNTIEAKKIEGQPQEDEDKSPFKINDNASKASQIEQAQNKLLDIKKEMNIMFMEREDLVDIMLNALVSNTNVLMLGDPGTAKSKFTQEICSRITGGNYFQWMLNKTSDPSEILGPFSIKEMENDKFARITEGKLPEANIAFLDEIYKCNSPVLNTLLTIMNEHIFYNDGKPIDVPLLTLVGASNEPPEDDSLAALHDRFIQRINLEYVKDTGNRKSMHRNYILERSGATINAAKTKISVAEIQLLQEASRKVKVDNTIITQFISLINELARQNIHISDRRQNECFKILQSSAVLHKRNVVALDDFNALIYVLWQKEEDIDIIRTKISGIAKPLDNKFDTIKNQFQEIKNRIDSSTNSKDKMQATIESKKGIEKIVTNLSKLVIQAQQMGIDSQEIIDFKNNVALYQQNIISEIMNFNKYGEDEE